MIHVLSYIVKNNTTLTSTGIIFNYPNKKWIYTVIDNKSIVIKFSIIKVANNNSFCLISPNVVPKFQLFYECFMLVWYMTIIPFLFPKSVYFE